MRKLISLVLLGLVGCGPNSSPPNVVGRPMPIVTIDSTFQSYYDAFEKDFGVRVTLPIGFDKLRESIAGQCERYSDGSRLIRIDYDYWQDLPDSARVELVYHELGHCVFNREHDTRTDTDKNGRVCPHSIMYPVNFGSPCYDSNLSSYLAGLPFND